MRFSETKNLQNNFSSGEKFVIIPVFIILLLIIIMASLLSIYASILFIFIN